jgi:N6-adenosine-specific RNA methylase IME4
MAGDLVPTDRTVWADRIRIHMTRTVEAVIATGTTLVEAKAALNHGDWLPLLAEVGMSARTAQMLMAIANSPLANACHARILPTGDITTLYHLTRLEPERLEAAIREGAVRPDLSRREAVQLTAKTLTGPAPALPSGKFNVILADPPWRYENAVDPSRFIENHYPTMSLDEIKALAIPAADDAVLYLWVTTPKNAEGLEVMEAWGFKYRTGMVWVKDKIGMGYYTRQRHELLLIGRRGDYPVPEPGVRPDSVIEAPRGRHSEKPSLVYDLVEAMYPAASKLEMFARRQRPGWTAWGNEAAA